MISGTMPWASSALMTPTCANPRAAPPPSASAILGAAGGAADLSGKFAHADKERGARSGWHGAWGTLRETDGSLPETRPEREIVADSSPVPVRAGIFRLSSKKDRKFLLRLDAGGAQDPAVALHLLLDEGRQLLGR